nr:hypothetical protein [uncultured bacterium]
METIIRRKPLPDPEYPDRKIRRVAFTGYRPQKMPFGFNEKDARCVDFKKRLYNTLESFIWQGYRHFLSGGALGMDMYAAETVMDLQKKNPGICLEMVSPFDAQAEKWETEYKKRHDFLFANADIVTMTGHEYTKSAMFVRNRYLVNNADLVLAAYDGQPGGTAMTINYAKKMGVRVCIIRPVAEKN